MWNAIQDWLHHVGMQYGVDPLVFAVIYLAAIPCFVTAVGWVVRRLLRGRPCTFPGLLAALFYLSSYLYVLVVGRNLPAWVYGLMVGLVATGGYFTVQNIRKRTARLHPHETDYDLIVIGGGAAGLTSAGIGASLGAKTLLIERDKLGGDCTWTGCVPSKTLLRSAKAAHQMREATRFGLTDHAPDVDFAQVMARVRETRRAVYEEADSPERLQAAGVEHTDRGIPVSDRCRTNQRPIFAVGDVTGRFQLTHMSEHMAKVACANALLKLARKIDADHVPWVTYTDPEPAHVGKTEAALKEAGTHYNVYRFPYDRLDRAVTDAATTGLIKVFASTWRGRILGATILGARAGELICEYALAMKHGVTLREIADTIHPYPTYGLGVRHAADQWYARWQTPRLVRFLQRTFGYRGEIVEPDPDRIV